MLMKDSMRRIIKNAGVRNVLGLVFIITLSLLLSGCKQQGSSTDPFVGGTNGLLINFAQGSPPSMIFDSGTTPFQVIVELQNDGEFTVPKDKVRVTLLGINPEEFGVTPQDLTKHPDQDLEKVRKDLSGNKVPSDKVQIVFPTFKFMNNVVADTQKELYAEVCYLYKTTARSDLCIKRNLMSTDSTVCQVNEKKKVYSSGAPIQVTSLEESQAGTNKIQFFFTIEKKGNGDVFTKESDCGSENYLTTQNKVYVTVDTGLNGLVCHGLQGGTTSGFVTLAGGKATVDCVQDLSNVESDFKQTITINLEYDFRNTIQTTFLIRPSQQ